MSNDDRPILSPEIQAAADAIKERRRPTRLVYAEDLRVGQVIAAKRQCSHPIASMLGESHEHGVEERTVLEIRTAGDIVSCITVDEEGEQRPLVEHRLSTVRVIAE